MVEEDQKDMRQLNGEETLAIADVLTDAYVEVFTAPPFEHRDAEQTRTAFRKRLEADVRRPGFRAILSTSDRGIDGFVTGWITQSPFRTDRSYGQVIERLGPERVERLLVGAYEIDELGVREYARGTGLAQKLLESFTGGARAWLLAWHQNHVALTFYRKAGWTEPKPLPGNETDIVVFLSPAASAIG